MERSREQEELEWGVQDNYDENVVGPCEITLSGETKDTLYLFFPVI